MALERVWLEMHIFMTSAWGITQTALKRFLLCSFGMPTTRWTKSKISARTSTGHTPYWYKINMENYFDTLCRHETLSADRDTVSLLSWVCINLLKITTFGAKILEIDSRWSQSWFNSWIESSATKEHHQLAPTPDGCKIDAGEKKSHAWFMWMMIDTILGHHGIKWIMQCTFATR